MTAMRWLFLALALAAPPAVGGAPRLALDARVVWSSGDPAFGGFSALDVADDGAGFVAIGDRGAWATARMIRERGRLTRVELAALGPLRAISGDALGGGDADAEGLAVDADGGLWVSFEGFHRIRRYDAIDGPAQAVPPHRRFARLGENSGVEALAIDADGVLHAIPERSGRLDRPFPVFRFADGRWLPTLRLPRDGPWQVSGADFGPDGRLYLLERDFSWMGGFATRLRRFTVGPDGFDAGETLLETAMGSTDNFEGVSVWRDPAGAIRVTLIADDNFFPLQDTVVAEYRLIGG